MKDNDWKILKIGNLPYGMFIGTRYYVDFFTKDDLEKMMFGC